MYAIIVIQTTRLNICKKKENKSEPSKKIVKQFRKVSFEKIMTNEWIDWSDARLRVPLRTTGYPYPPQSYYTANNNNNTSNSNSSNISTCNTLNTSNATTTTCNSNNNNYLSCFTKNKFHFKNHKIQQLYTTAHGKLKGI